MTGTAQSYDLSQPIPDQVEAGRLLEKAGKQRNTALLVVGTGALLAVAMSAQADGDPDMTKTAVMFGGVVGIIGLGINVGANNNERKAGRKLQGL